MDLFNEMSSLGHEQVVVCHEPSCGYLGIIAIHDTTLGPALGGTRYWNYGSFDEAVTDALIWVLPAFLWRFRGGRSTARAWWLGFAAALLLEVLQLFV